MFRFIGFSVLCAVGTAAGLNAGQIQVGGAAGLTAAYVGAQPAGVGERNYVTTLFGGDTENGAAPVVPASTLTDPNDGVTFSIMNDGGNNYWAINSSSAAPVTMTIPVGIFGITNVWTMLNDAWGITGNQNTSVVFNFGTSAGVANGGSQTFNFTNGTEIRDAVDCTGVSTSPAPGGNPTDFPSPCTTFARTKTGSTSQAFATAYNGNTNAASEYFNTSGNLVLDDQGLAVNPIFFGKYLVNVQVSNVNGGPNNSRTVLSAITVATPEPASVAMFLGGMTGMFLLYSRRRKAASFKV